MNTPTHALTLALFDDGWHAVINVPATGATANHAIDSVRAETVGRAFSDILPNDATPSPIAIVREGNQGLKDRLEKALKEAEAQATAVPHLRKKLADLQGTS